MKAIYKQTIYTLIILYTLWFAMSMNLHFFPLVPGIITIPLITYLFIRIQKSTNQYIGSSINILKFIKYTLWLFIEIIKSNIFVIQCVIKNNINPQMVKVPNNLKTTQGAVLVGNSITATPGTITTDIDSNFIHVHALNSTTAEGAMGMDMNDRVQSIETIKD